MSDTPTHVSTGHLPQPDDVQALLVEAYDRFRENDDGALSTVYPALQEMPRDLFGLCVVGVTGAVYEIGDVGVEFAIMSVAKPFAFALACEAVGAPAIRSTVGVNATGLPFDALPPEDGRPNCGRTNPMVNAGAIATVSLVPGATPDDRWSILRDGLSRFAGRELTLDDAIYASASETNHRNREIVRVLERLGRLAGDAAEALDLYTRQCSLRVTAHDLATMGATLADGGVNPMTRERVVSEETCRRTLTVMATAGLYETSGEWLYEVGLPGKSGIGGGIVTVSPGKAGLGTFAPLLDVVGNSVKGQLAAKLLSRSLGMDLFASNPAA